MTAQIIPERISSDLADALIIGRAGMDLYPHPAGTKTRDAQSFVSDMGGSAGNIAASMARLGAQVALAAPVSNDPVGQFVKRQLNDFDIAHIDGRSVDGQARTSLALAELVDVGSETVIYRNNAADFCLTEADLAPWLGKTRLTVVTGTALARDPSRTACLRALHDARLGVLDLDYRPYSWTADEATRTYQAAARGAQIIVGNDEEFSVFDPDTSPRAAAQALAEQDKTVLFKEGAHGCTVFKGDNENFLPAFSVKALKPFGAGDAFLGTTLYCLMSGKSIETAAREGAAAAALVVQRPGCASAMPTRQEIDTFLASKEAD